MFYYFSIGTNLEPERNAVSIVKMLSDKFGPIVLYPFIYTQPENIATSKIFLNSLAIIFSPLDEKNIKYILNNIEISLGRNRKDPLRSKKDRVADIDILGYSKDHNGNFFDRYEEPYIKRVIINKKNSVDLSALGLPSSERPATINFDATAGHIRVLQNTADGLINWHKPTLALQ